MNKRRFYIFGHNPNNVDDAVEALKSGANAIEPDVVFDDELQRFEVREQLFFLPRFISRWLFSGPSLGEYLQVLRIRLEQDRSLDLALIAFDLKEPYSYDVNMLFDTIRKNFSNYFPRVQILTTVSNAMGMPFLAQLNPQQGNEIVGVDEYTEPDTVHNFFRARGLRHAYANGSGFFLTSTRGFRKDIERATELRDQGGGNLLGLVYVWTVNSEKSMRFYLDRNVDGMITDNVPELLALLKTEYADRYSFNLRSSASQSVQS
jgi:hypothetical protein